MYASNFTKKLAQEGMKAMASYTKSILSQKSKDDGGALGGDEGVEGIEWEWEEEVVVPKVGRGGWDEVKKGEGVDWLWKSFDPSTNEWVWDYTTNNIGDHAGGGGASDVDGGEMEEGLEARSEGMEWENVEGAVGLDEGENGENEEGDAGDEDGGWDDGLGELDAILALMGEAYEVGM